MYIYVYMCICTYITQILYMIIWIINMYIQSLEPQHAGLRAISKQGSLSTIIVNQHGDTFLPSHLPPFLAMIIFSTSHFLMATTS